MTFFSDSPILLDNQLFLTRCTYISENEKGLNFHRMSSCSGDGRGGNTSTPQAENKKYQSVGTRSRVTRRGRRSRVTRKCLYVAFAACVVRQLRSRYRLLDDVVRGRLHIITVCMTRCGFRAAFVWLCKPPTIEEHVLYHATVVSRRTW